MRKILPAMLLAVGCASPPPPPAESPAVVAAPAPSGSGPSAQLVNALVLTNGCPELGKKGAMAADTAMNALVEGCDSVPGGSMQFHATLQPGGQIEISATPGQPAVVPICILKHALVHKVPLTRPCPLEVKIEQTSVSMPASSPSAASQDAGPG